VTTVAWSPCGTHFATCSHDKTVVVYCQAEGAWAAQGKLNFSGVAEALTWVNAETVVTAVRDDNYLHYVDAASLQDRKINMNVAGDDHVSFTVLDMAASPCGNYIALCTDISRVIMMPTGKGQTHIRVFHGANNDKWSSPRVSWGQTSRYVYATSQDNTIIAWDVKDQKIVSTLTGHSQTIKALDMLRPVSGTEAVLVSCSFDKTVRVWTSSGE